MRPSAAIVGAGPNGLAAGIALAQAGFDVEVREAAACIGGGARSAEVTLPGFVHDLGSAVHPMAVASPFFSRLPLAEHGLQWAWPPAALAHPLDDGTAVTLETDVASTAAQLGEDAAAYRRILTPLVERWEQIRHDALKALGWPRHPLAMASFGVQSLRSARGFAEKKFKGQRARALFAGLAAHSMLPLEAPRTAAFGLIFALTGHAVGWPIPRGGAQSIATALEACLLAAGGRVRTNARVSSLAELDDRDVVLCDITPRQLLALARERMPHAFRRELEDFRYGPGVFKLDWALSQPIPWRAAECLRAGTVHIGGTLDEIAASESAVWRNQFNGRPFVLISQPTLFDPTRAPEGRHTAWAYCHVPNAWPGSAAEAIESQIERFAPGFRDCILARKAWGTAEMEAWNENLVGGDINGGAFSGAQMFLRPTWRQYSTPMKGVYLCSSSTPPGGGVHGMCGYGAAQWAIHAYRSRPHARRVYSHR